AYRLLLARRDRVGVIGPLLDLLNDPQAPPGSGVAALRLLEALDSLDDLAVLVGMGHPSAPVRETALGWGEVRLGVDRDRFWLARVLKLADDPDARVRFRAAIALGSVDSK